MNANGMRKPPFVHVQALPLPGQGPRGTVRRISLIADASMNGLPETIIPSSWIGNTVAPLIPCVTASGDLQCDSVESSALERSLALAVAAIRREIMGLRQPGAAVKKVTDTAALVSAEGYGAFMTALGSQPLDVTITCCTPRPCVLFVDLVQFG